jgi:hypothetical protein
MGQDAMWRAIVAFNSSEDVSEDWNWFFRDVVEACKGRGIFVIYAGPKDRQIIIGPEERPFASLDMSEYFKYLRGYVFIEDGRDAEYQEYDQSYVVLTKASKYFGISL